MPYTSKWAMQQHINNPKVVDAAVLCTSALLTDNEEQKGFICQQVAHEMIAALELYVDDEKLFGRACRCIGNMTLADVCILELCKHGCVGVIASGVGKHLKSPESMKVVLGIFANLSSVDDEDADAEVTKALLEQVSREERDLLLLPSLDREVREGTENKEGRI